MEHATNALGLVVLPERAGGSVNGLVDDGRTRIAGAVNGSRTLAEVVVKALLVGLC